MQYRHVSLGAGRLEYAMRITSSDKTVLLLIGMVIIIAGVFTFVNAQKPTEELSKVEPETTPASRPLVSTEDALRSVVYGAVSKDIVRTVEIAYDTARDTYNVRVSIDDVTDAEIDQHAPSTKLYYELYKQKDASIGNVVVSVYHEIINPYDAVEEVLAFETQLDKQVVSNTINFSPEESKVRQMIGEKWTVIYDKRDDDAKREAKRDKQGLRAKYGLIKVHMTEEAVEDIVGSDGTCTKDSTRADEAKICTYAEQVVVRYLYSRVTDKEFIARKRE